MAAATAEAPARIRDTHIRDRFVSETARTAEGWRNETWPIRIAYNKGRLASKSGLALARWLAFEEYSAIFETALCRSGRDSTDMDVVSGGSGFPISEAMNTAIRKLISIDSHMAQKDRTIVRKLCEGHTLPEAVQAACGDDFTDTVAARVRDAIDAMSEAHIAARENQYRYVRMRL